MLLKSFDSWEQVKTSTLTGVWKKLISALMDNFEGIKMYMAITRGLEAEPEDATELLQSHDKANGWKRKCFLPEEQRKAFIEMKSIPGEDAGNIGELRKLHKQS